MEAPLPKARVCVRAPAQGSEANLRAIGHRSPTATRAAAAAADFRQGPLSAV